MKSRVPACAVLLTCLGIAARVEAGAADRPWRLIRGRNVTVIGQQSPSTLRRVAVHIEQFRMALAAILPAARQPLPVPTVVYTFDDRKPMEPFVPLYQGKPAAIAGFCHCGSTGDLNLIVASLANFADTSAIIYHEYTHLILGNAIRHVPVWLNEGLAEYYSTFSLTNDERTAIVGRVIAHHVLLLRSSYVPISEILAADHLSALYNETDRRSIFYAEAWALTHYLMNQRPGGAAKVGQYLDAIANGQSPDAAFAGAFETSPAQMDKELQAYVRRFTFGAFSYTLTNRVEVDQPEKAAALTMGEASARLGGIQLRVGRAEEGAARIEAGASADPVSAEAQLTLALLRLRQGRSADAWAPLQKAAVLAPGDFLTQYAYALVLLRREVNQEDAPSDSLERAHTALTRAIAANPQSTEALAWLAFADVEARTRLEEAQTAISRAIELAPARLDFRLRLAQVLVLQGDEPKARALLTVLAAATRDAEVADRAGSLLRQLEAIAERRAEAAARPPAAPAVTVAAVERPVDAFREAERPTFRLRTVRTGEQRAYGMLTTIDCSPALVRFHLAVGSRVVIATASRMADVELTRFVGDKDDRVACGPRVPPDAVYLTWRMAKAPAGQPAVVGTAVSVEFVPLGYVP